MVVQIILATLYLVIATATAVQVTMYRLAQEFTTTWPSHFVIDALDAIVWVQSRKVFLRSVATGLFWPLALIRLIGLAFYVLARDPFATSLKR